MTLVLSFVQDERTLILFGLIVVDLVVGIIAALRTGVFDPRSVGQFYRTNVVPYILGYLLVYVISLWGIGALLGSVWGEVAATVGSGPAVINLSTSIIRNLAKTRPEGTA